MCEKKGFVVTSGKNKNWMRSFGPGPVGPESVLLHIFGLVRPCCVLSLVRNKNAIKPVPREKHQQQNSSKRALLCSASQVLNSVHMFPFDPRYCSQWNTNPGDIPATTWQGLPQGRGETTFASLRACISLRPCAFVCVLDLIGRGHHTQLSLAVLSWWGWVLQTWALWMRWASWMRWFIHQVCTADHCHCGKGRCQDFCRAGSLTWHE